MTILEDPLGRMKSFRQLLPVLSSVTIYGRWLRLRPLRYQESRLCVINTISIIILKLAEAPRASVDGAVTSFFWNPVGMRLIRLKA